MLSFRLSSSSSFLSVVSILGFWVLLEVFLTLSLLSQEVLLAYSCHDLIDHVACCFELFGHLRAALLSFTHLASDLEIDQVRSSLLKHFAAPEKCLSDMVMRQTFSFNIARARLLNAFFQTLHRFLELVTALAQKLDP